MIDDFQSCRRKLATIWFSLSTIVFVLTFVLTIAGYYGDEWERVWSWSFATFLPTLSLIIGVLVADTVNQASLPRSVDRFLFRLAYWLSIAYLVVVILTILSQPLVEERAELLGKSHLWLAPLQGLATAALGAFFIRRDVEKS